MRVTQPREGEKVSVESLEGMIDYWVTWSENGERLEDGNGERREAGRDRTGSWVDTVSKWLWVWK